MAAALFRYFATEHTAITGIALGLLFPSAAIMAGQAAFRFTHRNVDRTKPDKDFLLYKIDAYKESDVEDLEAVRRGVEAKLKALRRNQASNRAVKDYGDVAEFICC